MSYLLFSQVLYKPVEDLLKVMYEVKTGNLETEAPVRARDEFGQLAISFNHMISRLREMTAERAASVGEEGLGVSLVTPEPAPLAALGEIASHAVGALLERGRVRV